MRVALFPFLLLRADLSFHFQTGTSDSVHDQDRPQPPQLSHVYENRIGHTEQCPCGTGSQTTEHLLQSCPIYEPLRKGIWPDHTPVARKLYGSLGNLRFTATFIEKTGVSVRRTRRRSQPDNNNKSNLYNAIRH